MRATTTWPEALWASGLGIATMALYWLTLAPGLLGLIDTPKFQFVGAILGVPHPPGYPIYVLVSYLFSHLPFGSLAYRMNLMSAVFGAVTVGLVFLCGRQAGAGRLSSAVGALGLGCGQLFWSTAVVAEVYTLHTALLAGIILSLQRWAHSRSSAAYYTAVACVAVSLGHHTTMALLGPAFAAYVVLVDPRYAFRMPRAALTAGLLMLGLIPYAFIAVRTAQGASYIETPITSFADGAAAVLSRRWQSAVFAFDLSTLLGVRVPFVAATLSREFSLPGLVVAGSGFAYLVWQRHPLAVLLGLAGLINALFVLVYDIVEISVFLLPTILTGWLCVTMALGQGISRVRGSWWPTTALLGAALIGWTGWQVQRGYTASDRSGEVQEMRRFDALFDALPAKSVIVSNDYLVDSMVRYKLLGERAARDRDVRGPERPDRDRLQRLHERGFEVFAFADSARRLRLQGFRFVDMLLTESVQDHLEFLPDGAVVAIAAPVGTAGPFAGHSAERIGSRGPLAMPSALSLVSGAIVGVASTPSGALEDWGPDDLRLNLGEGVEIGATGVPTPTAIEVRTGSGVGSVRWGSGQTLEATDGAVLLELNPDGSVREGHIVSRETRYGVELDQRRQGFGTTHIPDMRLHRLLDPGECNEIEADEWTDIIHFARDGKVAASLAGAASLTIYAGRGTPLAPRLTYGADAGAVQLSAQRVVMNEEALGRLRRELGDGEPLEALTSAPPPFLYRLVIDRSANLSADTAMTLVFGGVPNVAFARRSDESASSARLCSATLGYDGLFGNPARRVERLDWQRTGHDEFLGHGWSRLAPRRPRQTAEVAELLLPLWRRRELSVSVTGLRPGFTRGAVGAVQLEVNGTRLERREVRPGWNDYIWVVPDRVVRRGLNQAFLHVSGDVGDSSTPDSVPGLRVREITLTMSPDPLAAP